ncbi:MAG: VCBS repeat-containing protein [Bacteroidales bacterium]
MKSNNYTGIDFINTINENDTFNILTFEYIYNGAGVGIADFNNDGLMDIVFAGNMVKPAVYQNTGRLKFINITESLEGLQAGPWYSGVTIVDINSDYKPDIYLTCTGYKNPQRRKNQLWINMWDTVPRFVEKAAEFGIADTGYSVHAAFFDYDLDNDLDLYILNNYLSEELTSGYRQKITDGSATSNDRFYINNSNGTFTDFTIKAGIVYEGFGLGLAISDFNKDNYPDIYISNDYLSNDLLYINNQNGTFSNQIKKYLSYQTKSSMGNDVADINNDGFPDIYTMDMLPETFPRIKQTINGFGYIYYINDEKFGFEHQYIRNMLHLHNGIIGNKMVPFSELGQMMGIYKTEWSWSPLFADYDNDGDKDLLISNGYPTDLTDKDWTIYRMKTLGIFSDTLAVVSYAPKVHVPNIAFENTGNYRFRTATKKWLPNIPSYSNGAAFADLDNDGDLDWITNNINEKPFIYENLTDKKLKNKSNFIKIKLSSKSPNIQGIGAKIEIWANKSYQFTENFPFRGYASSVTPLIHFGLADNTFVDSVKITWPSSGSVTVIKNINVNSVIEVSEEKSIYQEANGGKINYLFESDTGIFNYKHSQKDFVDFALSQKIIPHKFSQIGPVLVTGDINNDGTDDILIGSTNSSPLKVFVKSGSKFVETFIKGLCIATITPCSDMVIADFDNDGDNDVITVAGGYESRKNENYKHYLYENSNGEFLQSELPLRGFPASVVRPCDFNRDGLIDIFIGSRVKLDMFPFSDSSAILINDKGKFLKNKVIKIDAGMVTDAVWSDFDGDGWLDLLIAREWNSLITLKNNRKGGVEQVIIPENEAMHGIWYSITACDLNQDGRDDYIAGNLGENHRFNVSNKYPLFIYASDLNLDGTIDPLMTGYWQNEKGKPTEYPVNYLDELCLQTAFFKSIFPDYKSFSYANVKDILRESNNAEIYFRLFVNTTSSYIILNDNGRFKFKKLPAEAQFSPLKYVVVTDLNDDALPDLIIAGNDHSYDVATGFYDSMKGLVLINKGNGNLNVLMPNRSGLVINGMTESLLLYKNDSPLIIAGINRSKAIVYKIMKQNIKP